MSWEVSSPITKQDLFLNNSNVMLHFNINNSSTETFCPVFKCNLLSLAVV
jgi:hypothetical protein